MHGVWSARTLLRVEPSCVPDVVAALHDPAWRVREMCCQVAYRWEVELLPGEPRRLRVPVISGAIVERNGAAFVHLDPTLVVVGTVVRAPDVA